MNLIVDIQYTCIHVCFLTVPVKFFNVFFIFFLYLNLKRTELQCNYPSQSELPILAVYKQLLGSLDILGQFLSSF